MSKTFREWDRNAWAYGIVPSHSRNADPTHLGRTHLISLGETLDVGTDAGTPVTDDYPARGNEFSGKVNWVQIDLGLDDHSHMLDIEQMVSVRMAKQ